MPIIISGPSSAGCSCRCFRRICCFRYCIWAVPGFSATPASRSSRQPTLLSPAAAPSIWLFGFYAIYPLLLRYFNRCRLHHRLHRFIIQVILLQLFWKICNNISCSNQAVILTLEITTFLRYIAYFSFGMLAYIYHKKMLRWIDTHHVLLMTGFILNLILIGGCWFAKYYLHILPLLEFVCFPLNLFLYSIIIAMLFRYACTLESQDSLSKRFMMYLGNYSFGLFLIHIIYMYVGSELLTLLHMSPQQLCFYPLLFIIMLSLSLLTMEALARVSWGHYFIGHVSRL